MSRVFITDWRLAIGLDQRGVRRVSIAICVLNLLSSYGYGQTCCSGGVPLTANIGLPIAAEGAFQFYLSYDYNRLITLKTGSMELDDKRRERITRSFLLNSGYSFTPRISADLFLSYVIQERNIFTPQGVNSTVTSGIGDGVFLIKYNFLLNSNRSSLVGGIGPKIPFGQTDKTASSGIALPADLQPGSGAWDLVLWGNYSQTLLIRPTMSFSLTTTYRETGVNPDYLGSIAYEFGNEVQVIAGIADQFAFGSSIWDPSISFRYRNAGRDTNNKVEIDATGGEWIFFMPGLRYSFNPAIAIILTVELPLYSFVNNTQLTPTNRITAGIYYRLNK